MQIDPVLFEFCATDSQRRILTAIETEGNFYKAAKALGMNRSTPAKLYRKLQERAALAGHAPGSSTIQARVPPGFEVKRLSARFAGGWLISEPKRGLDAESIVAAMEERAEALPVFPPRPAPPRVGNQLLNLFHYHDFHLGMRSWKHGGGDEWNLEIASRTFRRSIEHLRSRAPQADVAVLALNGDFFHANGSEPLTPRGKHLLDVDGEWQATFERGLDLVCDAIDALLTDHLNVKVLPIEGNHDRDAMIALRVALKRLYRDEPRVWIMVEDNPYYAMLHGTTMLGFHHGHLRKLQALLETFTGNYREMWGKARRVYVHSGHLHHRREERGGAMNLSQHPTYAARDDYAKRGGYVADRGGSILTYHAEWGLWNEAHLAAEMLA